MTKRKTYLAEDEDQVNKAQEADADRENDIIKLMELQRGRRWIYNLIYETCHAGASSHVPGDSDSTAFNEGARAVALTVETDARRSPNFIKMLQENFPND